MRWDRVDGDRDGVVVIPKEVATEADGETIKVMNTESNMREAIVGGMDPEAAYLEYGKF